MVWRAPSSYRNAFAGKLNREHKNFRCIHNTMNNFIILTIPKKMVTVYLTTMLCHLKSAQITTKHCLSW